VGTGRQRGAWAAALVVGAALAGAAGAQGKVGPATVIARAGEAPITFQALTQQLLRFYGRSSLEQLVNRSVVRLDAARFKAEVPEAEVDAALTEVKKNAGADFAPSLEARGVTEAMVRERIKADLLVEKLLDKKWPVKDSDLARYSIRYARLQTEKVAREFIQEAIASRGQNFELLVLQRSLDKEEGGLVQPNPFLRIENPPFFKIADDAIRAEGIRVGQVTKKPIPSKQFWLVLKLEGYYPADTLTGPKRAEAIRKVRAYRLPALIPTTRKRYKVENAVPAADLPNLADKPADTLVARVSFSGAPAASEEIRKGDLFRYALETYGRVALEQLVERSIITQQAARQNVTVSDSEVDARIAAVKKGTDTKAFDAALVLEGITEEAWRERVRYTYLAEKVVNARAPLTPDDFVRLTARYIRLGTKEDADRVLRLAQGTAPFDQLVKQHSLDRNSDGYLKPRAFLRAEQPELFRTLRPLTPGQVLGRPVELGGAYFIFKLEARLGPETLMGKEREDAVRRINALRMGPLLDSWRREIAIAYPVPMREVVAAGAG
jgi:parvulin-like peptidyl-prolyl isomerase